VQRPDIDLSVNKIYRHSIMMIDALPKTNGPEKLVPVVVALKALL